MKLVITLLLWVFSTVVIGAGGGSQLLEANVTLGSKTALQRGARVFVNYCVSCHSASYMRYNRMVEDLGLDERAVMTNLMFTTDKIGDTMSAAMRPQDAEAWFGVAPPDLSVIARSRGADWLYSFLLGFYLDENRPTGVNNLYFEDTAMPHVLWELQGLRQIVHEKADDHGQGGTQFETVLPGKLSEGEYAKVARDLVSFMVYLGEPAKLVRYRVGFWVIAFLLVLLLVTYLLKREFWKDVH